MFQLFFRNNWNNTNYDAGYGKECSNHLCRIIRVLYKNYRPMENITKLITDERYLTASSGYFWVMVWYIFLKIWMKEMNTFVLGSTKLPNNTSNTRSTKIPESSTKIEKRKSLRWSKIAYTIHFVILVKYSVHLEIEIWNFKFQPKRWISFLYWFGYYLMEIH